MQLSVIESGVPAMLRPRGTRLIADSFRAIAGCLPLLLMAAGPACAASCEWLKT